MSDYTWWVLIFAGILLAPMLLLLIVGLINGGRHTATVKLMLRQTPKTVWEAITQPERYPAWWSEVKRVEQRPQTSEGQTVWGFIFAGRSERGIDFIVTQSDEHKRWELTVAAGKMFRGRWIYELTATSEGCELKLTEEAEVTNPVMAGGMRLFMKPDANIRSFVAALASKFGEKSS